MKPRQLYYVLFASLGVIALATLAIFWLLHGQLNNRISTLQRLSGDIAIENEQLEHLKKLAADLEAIEPLANKVQEVLPAQKQQDEVVAQISAIVRKNGLQLSGLTFESTKGLPDERSQTESSTISGILLMPVHFTTESSYSKLVNLLQSFERQQRFMRVSTMEIGRNNDGSIKANIALEVFLKP